MVGNFDPVSRVSPNKTMEMDILAQPRNRGSEYVISINIIHFRTVFICDKY